MRFRRLQQYRRRYTPGQRRPAPPPRPSRPALLQPVPQPERAPARWPASRPSPTDGPTSPRGYPPRCGSSTPSCACGRHRLPGCRSPASTAGCEHRRSPPRAEHSGPGQDAADRADRARSLQTSQHGASAASVGTPPPSEESRRAGTARETSTDEPAGGVEHFPQVVLALRGIWCHEREIGRDRRPPKR